MENLVLTPISFWTWWLSALDEQQNRWRALKILMFRSYSWPVKYKSLWEAHRYSIFKKLTRWGSFFWDFMSLFCYQFRPLAAKLTLQKYCKSYKYFRSSGSPVSSPLWHQWHRARKILFLGILSVGSLKIINCLFQGMVWTLKTHALLKADSPKPIAAHSRKTGWMHEI